MKKVTSILTTMLLLCFPAYSQDESLTDSQTEQKSKEIEIYFDHDSYVINLDSPQNRNTLDNLPSIIEGLQADSLTSISKIVISGYSSPGGDNDYNNNLSTKRANSIYDYLSEAISVPDIIIERCNLGTDWDRLCRIVEASDMEYKADVLNIIKTVPEETWRRVNPTDRWQTLVDSRNKHLMDLEYGNPYRWMQANLFSHLSRGVVTIIYRQTAVPQVIEEEAQIITTEIVEPVIEEIHDTQDDVTEVVTQIATESEDKLLFAIKTNLLQLGVGVANIGVEIQLGNSFSLDIPFTYSPYTINREWNLQILALQPEFRYWLNKPFQGHFFGAHLHVGYYDVAWNSKTRYQDRNGENPLYGGGISYGYLLDLTKKLDMEFVVGFGYVRLDYDIYYNIENGAKYDSRQLNYWGPTRLGINLNYKFNKGR